MNTVPQVDEALSSCRESLHEHSSKVSDLIARERIDELLELRQRLTDEADDAAH